MLNASVTSYYSNINNINYDYDFLCTYKLHSDDDDRNLCYQLQLLQALKITNYDPTLLITYIDKISFFLQNNTELDAILILLKEKYKTTNLAFIIDECNNCVLFQMLFSYDYFDIFHKCLCKYIHDKKHDKKQPGEHGLTISYFDDLKCAITL